jgi:hypothetical protein
MGITSICVGKSAKEVLIGTMEGHVQRIMIWIQKNSLIKFLTIIPKKLWGITMVSKSVGQ